MVTLVLLLIRAFTGIMMFFEIIINPAVSIRVSFIRSTDITDGWNNGGLHVLISLAPSLKVILSW